MEDFPNNLHHVDDRDTAWSRVNAAEAFPGVQTPLSWDFFNIPGERAKRASQFDIGKIGTDKGIVERVSV